MNGECKVCNGDPNKQCCGGQCITKCDPNKCEVCDSNGHCIVCDGDMTKCCVEGQCKTFCGGQCCGANKYCCGNFGEGKCCDANEVCCTNVLTGEHFCNSSCGDIHVVDTASCSEDNEDDYKCNGCNQGTDLQCGYFRDYTGLQIKECTGGCTYSMPERICYEVKECTAVLYPNSFCDECDDIVKCWGILHPPDANECRTAGECAIQITCNILMTCFQCDGLDGAVVVTTVESQTCTACYDY